MATMWDVVDKIYDDLRRLAITIVDAKKDQAVAKKEDAIQHLDKENGFQLLIPKHWVLDKEVVKLNSLTKMCLQLFHEDIVGFIHPSINVVTEVVGKTKIEQYIQISQVTLAGAGAEILDVSINPQLSEASIKSLMPNPFFRDKKASLMQKIVIRNKNAYIITISQLSTEEMSQEQNIVNDITKIIQSFSFIAEE